MTTKELAKDLKEHIGCGVEVPLYDEELEVVVEALEKQIAKKPRIIRITDDTEYMKCSQCKLATGLYSDMKPDYCPNCGQKIDWSEYDD